MKQFEALYIDGQLVNIGRSDITLEWKSVMLSDISKIKSNHSYTIKLPMTSNNRRVFNAAEDAAHDAHVFANDGRLTIGRRMRARYYCNGVDLLGDASAFLIGVEGDCYKVVLTWGRLSVLEDVISEDRNLPEIFDNDETEPTMVYWEKWSEERISDALGDNVIWVPYTKTKYGDISLGYCHELPSLKVTWIIDKIFRKYGISYDFSKAYLVDGHQTVKTEELLDSLYCPMVTLNDSKYVQSRNHGKFYITQAESENLKYTNLYASVPLYIERASPIFPENAYTPVLGWCGTHQNMKYRIKTHVRAFVLHGDAMDGYAWLKSNVKLAVVNGSGTDASQLASVIATSIRSIGVCRNSFIPIFFTNATCYEMIFDYDDWVEVNEGDTPGGDYWQDLSFDEALKERQRRTLRITHPYVVLAINDLHFLSGGSPDTIDQSWVNWVEVCPVLTSGKTWNSTYAAITAVDEKSPIYIEPNFPDMKPIDFLKAIFHIIGAFPVIKGNTLKLTLYSELVANCSKAPDWSRFIIDSNDIPDQIDFELTDWAKKNWMLYKDDDENAPEFSGFFEIDDDYLSEEKDLFEIPFKGCQTKGGVVIPIFELGKVLRQIAVPEDVDEAKEEVDGYVFKGADPCILHRTKVDMPTEVYGDVTIQAQSVSAFDFLSLSFANEDSIVRQRYKVLEELLRHPYVITVKMELDEFTLGNLDMEVPVFLRQYSSYFGIISVKRKSDGLCSVKLIKIPNTLITG